MKDLFMIVGDKLLDDGTLPVYSYDGKVQFTAAELEGAKLQTVRDNPHAKFVVVQVVGTYTSNIIPCEVVEA